MAFGWSTNQTLRASAALNAAATSNDDLDLAALGIARAEIAIKFSFTSPPKTGRVSIGVLETVDGGTTFSTDSILGPDVELTPIKFNESATLTITRIITVEGVPRVRVRTVNATELNGTLEIKYAGMTL